METSVSGSSVRSVHGDNAVGTKRRRRPKLSREMVETLHLAAWILGLVDVILVALTFALK